MKITAFVCRCIQAPKYLKKEKKSGTKCKKLKTHPAITVAGANDKVEDYFFVVSLSFAKELYLA